MMHRPAVVPAPPNCIKVIGFMYFFSGEPNASMLLVRNPNFG